MTSLATLTWFMTSSEWHETHYYDMTSPRSDRSSTSPSPSPGEMIISILNEFSNFVLRSLLWRGELCRPRCTAHTPSWLLQSWARAWTREGHWNRSDQNSEFSLSWTILSDYVEFTKALEKSIEESEEAFENGFYFPQPPSPSFFTEAPTPEFIGQCLVFSC